MYVQQCKQIMSVRTQKQTNKQTNKPDKLKLK